MHNALQGCKVTITRGCFNITWMSIAEDAERSENDSDFVVINDPQLAY